MWTAAADGGPSMTAGGAPASAAQDPRGEPPVTGTILVVDDQCFDTKLPRLDTGTKPRRAAADYEYVGVNSITVRHQNYLVLPES